MGPRLSANNLVAALCHEPLNAKTSANIISFLEALDRDREKTKSGTSFGKVAVDYFRGDGQDELNLNRHHSYGGIATVHPRMDITTTKSLWS